MCACSCAFVCMCVAMDVAVLGVGARNAGLCIGTTVKWLAKQSSSDIVALGERLEEIGGELVLGAFLGHVVALLAGVCSCVHAVGQPSGCFTIKVHSTPHVIRLQVDV